MTAVYVICGVVIFFSVLLSFSLTVYVKIADEVEVWVGAFGYKKKIDLQEKPESKKKKKKHKKKNTTKETVKKLPEKKPSEKSFSQAIEFAVTLFKSLLSSSLKILKHVRIQCLDLTMVISCEAADMTAITYGAVSAGVYTLLGVLDNTFKLAVKNVSISPDFTTHSSRYDISFRVKLRFLQIVVGGFGIIFNFLVNTINKGKNVDRVLQDDKKNV